MRTILTCLLFCLLSLPNSARAYEWTNQKGKTLEAEFVKRMGDVVVLKQGKRSIKVPYSSLIEEDRDFVDGLLAQQALQGGAKPSAHRPKPGKALPQPTPTTDDPGAILRQMVEKRDAEAAEKKAKLEEAKAAFNKKKGSRKAKSKKKKGGKKKK